MSSVHENKEKCVASQTQGKNKNDEHSIENLFFHQQIQAAQRKA